MTEEMQKFIKSGLYRELEEELASYADKYFKMEAGEDLPFTERLMKKYAVEKSRECFLDGLKNIRNRLNPKEIKPISWK
jgi:hypothetical protein